MAICPLWVIHVDFPTSALGPLVLQERATKRTFRKVSKVPKGDMASGNGLEVNCELACLYITFQEMARMCCEPHSL
jgi:hypothetical protein